MASTPETNFSGDDAHLQRPSHKNRDNNQLFVKTLPSPRRSDSDSSAIDPSDADASNAEFFDTDSSDTDTSEDVAAQDEAIRLAYLTILDHFCGITPEEDYPTFNLRNQRTYRRLYSKLAKQSGLLEHFESEIRKDWNATTGILTLRFMAKEVHEVCQFELLVALKGKVSCLVDEYPSLQAFRGKIIFAGHSPIIVKGRSRVPRFEKSPDGQTKYNGRAYFALEVAYSQSENDLLQKAREYFEDGPNPVFTLLNINIDYQRPATRAAQDYIHSASVSLYTSTPSNGEVTIRCLMDRHVFRNENGEAMPGELLIPFKLLLPLDERSKIPLDAQNAALRFSFESLSELVSDSEKAQQESETASSNPLPSSRKFTWVGEDGNVIRQAKVSEPQQQRTPSRTDQLLRPGRTRSAIQLRRSSRLRSASSRRGTGAQ
ncbi:hypothetical protein HD806DRAFT_516367 [Xylariaceae sp. AK1471]|nr:hypothetical protein HD806DRAFT_516367 [Xylariaceae sp. AK1471]